MRRVAWVAAAAMACVTAGAGAAMADRDETKGRLDKGEVIVTATKVSGSEFPRVKAFGVIDAAPAKVWAIIEDCAGYEKTMPRVARSKLLSKNGNKLRCEVVVDLPFPLGELRAVTDAVHTVEPSKKYRRAWDLVEGDYHRNKGSWTLVPFDDAGARTLAVYETHAEPKIAIPAGIQRAATKKTLPRLFENLRTLVK